MNRRIKYKLVLDTETCPINPRAEKVSPFNMLVYDVGYAICDRNGNIYRTRSFIVEEIFCGEFSRMKTSYYASKLPQYIKDLASGKRVLAKWSEIRETFNADIQEYNINSVYAHNMFFDYNSINRTCEWLKVEKNFFPSNVLICDTLRMSRDLLKKNRKYLKFCNENGYTTRRNLPRFTAEILYRFLTNDNSFIESHTGLEDVLIEKEILRFCYSRHKPMNELLKSEN